MQKRKTRIYISGPITGTTDYMERFEEVEKLLVSMDYDVINPAKVNASLPTSCSWQEYMALCYSMMHISDAIFLLENWTKSKGAVVEHNYMAKKNAPMVFQDKSKSEEEIKAIVEAHIKKLI